MKYKLIDCMNDSNICFVSISNKVDNVSNLSLKFDMSELDTVVVDAYKIYGKAGDLICVEDSVYPKTEHIGQFRISARCIAVLLNSDSSAEVYRNSTLYETIVRLLVCKHTDFDKENRDEKLVELETKLEKLFEEANFDD